VLNLIAFALELHAADTPALINGFALIPYDVTHRLTLAPPSPPNAYLTLVTAQFIHGGAFHLISNLIVLWAVGPAVEAATGHARFLAFYLLCGIAGNVVQVLMQPQSHVPSLGASGAIAGLLAAYLMLFPLRPVIWRIPAALVIVAWAVTQFAQGFASADQGGGIAYFTHIGGFLCGVIAIGLFRRREVAGSGAG
jgi:membrane associated rhomboid family serine protease